ncbi:MAG: FecR domain-containing protein, partial [Caulobacteraceae bacterium]|nr:FecR domain-containing protein [Caulobacteraceae bacterium]
AAAVLGGVVFSGILSTVDYTTALGERRVVTLTDGSRVTLDSASEVKVRYTRDARRLELLRGQARFDVAHNVMRPFSVKVGGETVVATGTAFNIDLLGPKVFVTLIEGHVSVLGARPEPRTAATGRRPVPRPEPIALSAGQQLVAAQTGGVNVRSANLDRTTAWEAGQLVFEDEPLGSVAARISRYTASPVSVDPSVADLRVSGVFNAGDLTTFVDTVTHYLPVQASDQPDGAVVLRRKG